MPAPREAPEQIISRLSAVKEHQASKIYRVNTGVQKAFNDHLGPMTIIGVLIAEIVLLFSKAKLRFIEQQIAAAQKEIFQRQQSEARDARLARQFSKAARRQNNRRRNNPAAPVRGMGTGRRGFFGFGS